MTTEKNTINGQDYRYVSQIPEFKEGLPYGILSKKATDVGGTFATIKCDSNYLIVVPFTDLIDSIVADTNNPHLVFGVYSGVSYNDFREYIQSHKIHKVATTFDSLPKVISWLDSLGINGFEYKVLVDEYHLLLEDMGFRDKAINNLMLYLGKFRHFTLMSATPINEDFLPSYMMELPYTDIDWGHKDKLFIERKQTNNVPTAICKLIDMFLKKELILNSTVGPKEVEELYIFMNSVKGIKQILDTMKLRQKDVKIVCANSTRNGLTLGSYEVSKITDPNAKINFFTKKGFQGCNLFTNNGLIVVASEGRKANTLVDVETTLYQIVGRLRTNEHFDNIFKKKVWHIFSTGTSCKFENEQDFESYIESLKSDVEVLQSLYSKGSAVDKMFIYKRTDVEDLPCYYDEEEDNYILSELKLKYLYYQRNLSLNVYRNGLTLQAAYKNADIESYKHKYDSVDSSILESITTVGFKQLYTIYSDLMSKESRDLTETAFLLKFRQENPTIVEAYTKLGDKKVNTLHYNEKDIQAALVCNSDSGLQVIFTQFFKQVGNNVFISNEDAKKVLLGIINKYRMVGVKTSTTILEECRWFKVEKAQQPINGKRVNGIKIIKY